VCDSAAGEACPVWPGHPATAHWGYADPSAGDAPDAVKREAFRHTLHEIGRRLELLMSLPPAKLQRACCRTPHAACPPIDFPTVTEPSP